jgi:hypothetical protein
MTDYNFKVSPLARRRCVPAANDIFKDSGMHFIAESRFGFKDRQKFKLYYL